MRPSLSDIDVERFVGKDQKESVIVIERVARKTGEGKGEGEGS